MYGRLGESGEIGVQNQEREDPMTDEKKIKDEELANMTGAGGPNLPDKKVPTGGGGSADNKTDTTGDGGSQPSDWTPN
jgi:hypothetical protein